MPEVKSPTRTAGWTKVAFGDVVRLCTERSSDPEADGFERYIGLEHLDPGELRVRRWGDLADGVTFTNVFRPGQVLFGKRRAYQRKVAVADFSGVCSGDIYVLEPSGDALLPELLPFICQTDAFFEHAVGTSAGSLSPRTNWESLADFEFALPPIEEQRRFASALNATWRCTDGLSTVVSTARSMRSALLNEFLRGQQHGQLQEHPILGPVHREWPVVPISDLLHVCQYGLSNPLSDRGQYPVLRMMNLSDGLVVPNDLKYLDLPETEAQKYLLHKGDVLFNRTNSYELVGRTAMHQLDGEYLFASYLVRLVPDASRLLPAYLVEYLNSGFGRTQVMGFASRGVSQTNVSASNLAKVLLPLPSLPEQEQTCRLLAELRRVEADALVRAGQVSEMGRMMQGLASGATP